MSEDPSIYLPRKLRPRPATSSEQSAAVDVPNPRHAAGMLAANEAPQNYASAQGSNSIHINTTDRMAEAICISGMLSKQICALQRPRRSLAAGADPCLCAFLLGYIDSDGTVHLNQLDQGIVHEARRMPTAVLGTDIAVPLFMGASVNQFYSCAIRPGFMYRMAGWVGGDYVVGDGGMVLEFINIGFDIAASVLTAPAVYIDSLPSLLAHIYKERDDGMGSSHGPLKWQDHDSRYIHEARPLTPPEDAVWANVANGGQSRAIEDAFLGAGAPWSLRVVQISPKADDYRTAVVRHTTVIPARNEYRIAVRLASIEIVGTSHWTTSTARLLSFLQYGQSASETINAISLGLGLSVVEPGAMRATGVLSSRKPPPRHQPSPKLEQLAAATHALVCGTPGAMARLERRAASAASLQKEHIVAEIASNGDGGHMRELLEEQRSIRRLLEEQNNLMKAHMSQTQELMRLAHYQPSPQTITRRYLRMKGTHTPITSGNRLSRSTVAAIEGSDASKAAVRRSNSLSEIVEDIRSFEVEGYEETEHVAGHAYRRPLSFATPLCTNASSEDCSLESIDRFPLASNGGVDAGGVSRIAPSSSNGITGLVSRINNLVCDKKESAGHGQKPAERQLALPAAARPPLPPGCTMPRQFKVTPTTQKYLDSLGQHQSQGQQQRRPQAPEAGYLEKKSSKSRPSI